MVNNTGRLVTGRTSAFQSWGRNPRVSHSQVFRPFWSSEVGQLDLAPGQSVLPHGLGRSYGDLPLNDEGALLVSTALDRIVDVDWESGLITAEGGISLTQLLEVIVPRGWFLPVSPGTKFVTLGGAIANDIHGKNQTKDGTFGCFVKEVLLWRSDQADGKGGLIRCSEEQNQELFRATVAGLGLTGFIVQATLQLKKIAGPFIDRETIPFRGLDQFFRLTAESENDFLYTVAWLDCLGTGSNFARGVFFRGNHSQKWGSHVDCQPGRTLFNAPFEFPNFTLNRLTLKAFNEVYFRLNSLLGGKSACHYDPFFYPLDSVDRWNLIYGPRGFFQFQCVVSIDRIESILSAIVDSKLLSFLGVLKCFGPIRSPGLLSFPREGITLALDFPNQGSRTRDLFLKLHEIVREGEGAIYPAKDAWMTPAEFREFYPNIEQFKQCIDPLFSSTFWRRVG